MTKQDVLRRPEENLKGEQKKVYRLEPTGPVLVKGGAGSGKTLVAIARARFLNQYAQSLFGAAKVGFFTYDKSLRDEVSSYLAGSSVYVNNIDSWVNQFLRRRGVEIGRLPSKESREDFRRCMQTAREEAFQGLSKKAIFEKGNDFYEDEICWIKGRMIFSEEEYMRTPRTGRGTADRVTAEDRHHLWTLKVVYDKIAGEMGLSTFEDLVNDAMALVESSPLSAQEAFTHVIVDEAQDFTLAKLRLISKITNGTANEKSITMFADAAQKIYQSGFSWKDANISVRGRSYEFKRNYRNTRQIAEAAYSLLSHEEDKSEMTVMELPEKNGSKPVLMHGGTDQMIDAIAKSVSSNGESKTVVAAYGFREINVLKSLLERKGLMVDMQGATTMLRYDRAKPKVYVRSLHKLKGLQFDHVYVWGLDAGRFPPAGDSDEDVSRFRMLLYVAMTRACENLTLCYNCRPAELLNEIDRALVDEQNVGGGYSCIRRVI